MGKRKSSAKPPPKKARPKLETTFACPFCNADKVCVGLKLLSSCHCARLRYEWHCVAGSLVAVAAGGAAPGGR